MTDEGAQPAPNLLCGRMVRFDGACDVIDPATGAAFARCATADSAAVDQAVAGARKAFPDWRGMPAAARADCLRRLGARVRDGGEAIAALLTREQGKPLADARAELRRAADYLESIGSIDLAPSRLRADDRGRVDLGWRPLGVVAGITPWNAPVILAVHKLAQALYTGNCIVLKPSPLAPLAVLEVARLAADLLPAGAFSVLVGGAELGAGLVGHPGIDKVSFTGSTDAGREVLAAAGQGLKRVTLELGGNDPAIVLDDADLDAAAAGIARAAFANCGQICMAVKRVYAAAPIHDALAAKIAALAAAIEVGPGDRPGTTMGPLQNRMQYDKVIDLLRRTHADRGARFLAGGGAIEGPGYFVEPTVVVGLDDEAPLVRQEQFGPVLPILPFADPDEAVAKANATEFGLGASVWSGNVGRARDIARRIEAGTVWINAHGGSAFDVPFGGAKASGIGREHGLAGLHSYMEMQVLAEPA